MIPFDARQLLGRRLDHFLLEEYIGEGAMGIVFRAHDTVLDRRVAIKLIRSLNSSTRVDAEKRLIREAKAAGRLSHPNIVMIHSFGISAEIPYICMEYVQGKDLNYILNKKIVLPISETIHIIKQLLLAIDTASNHGVIHRDLKPANILILNDGSVKVTDFGIAKIHSLSMTDTGTIMGTLSYMSPEQVAGQKVDVRTDIFSIGVIFYEMVSGTKPFHGDNLSAILYRILNEHPTPASELNPSIPPGLSAIIEKALSKDRDLRFQTPMDMLQAIRSQAPGHQAEPDGSNESTVVMDNRRQLNLLPQDNVVMRRLPLPKPKNDMDIGEPHPKPSSPPAPEDSIHPARSMRTPLSPALKNLAMVGLLVVLALSIKTPDLLRRVTSHSEIPASRNEPPTPLPTRNESITKVEIQPHPKLSNGKTELSETVIPPNPATAPPGIPEEAPRQVEAVTQLKRNMDTLGPSHLPRTDEPPVEGRSHHEGEPAYSSGDHAPKLSKIPVNTSLPVSPPRTTIDSTVDFLLAKAERARQQGRILAPQADSAVHYYGEILALDRGNEKAWESLLGMAEESVADAKKNANNPLFARQQLDRAEDILRSTPGQPPEPYGSSMQRMRNQMSGISASLSKPNTTIPTPPRPKSKGESTLSPAEKPKKPTSIGTRQGNILKEPFTSGTETHRSIMKEQLDIKQDSAPITKSTDKSSMKVKILKERLQ